MCSVKPLDGHHRRTGDDEEDGPVLDVIIVGGGPAGLSAALILGRARRRVILFDSGEPRNAASHSLHGFITCDGIDPAELRRIARAELVRYDTVEVRTGRVVDAERRDRWFEVALDDGSRVQSRALLLATGVLDRLPAVPGIEEFYGHGVHHCPYCDGWEAKDAPLAVYGRGKRGLGLALELTQWSRDLTLCTDGPSRLSNDSRRRLARNGIAIRTARIVRLDGRNRRLERVWFASGESLECRTLYFNVGQVQHADLVARLGCTLSTRGLVRPGKKQTTNVPGLYVAGDIAHDVQLAIVAAGEGARAASAINTALLREDLC
ncbi:MAG: NAD(P)/FAD-dependent oxidoreductase [Dehalococcoidia bacterium]